jgi:hypothetical protein
MDLITILNTCHHFRGFVYHHARFGREAISSRARRFAYIGT